MRRNEIALIDPSPSDRPGSRWMCGRDEDPTPCSHGPFADGRCPLANVCRPRRTWHGRRKRIVTLTWVMAAALTFLMLRPAVAPHVFKPGELSTPHAQILSGTNASDRCAACHPQATTMPDIWFRTNHAGHKDLTQTDRCLDCHHNVIQRDRATFAHNLQPATLAAFRSNLRLASARPDPPETGKSSWHDWMPGPSMQTQDIQCSACHREHRGQHGDLLEVSDSQCQTCHSDRFGSFASSHPSWDQWPYGRGRAVAFDHQTHANKHFPTSQQTGAPLVFDCSACHAVNASGELARAPSYERACAACHDGSLFIEAAAGLELLALPTIPQESAKQLAAWPETATGFYDGQLAPIAELLLRTAADAASAIRQIPDGKFGDVDGQNPVMVQSVMSIAEAHRQLLGDIALEGQSAILSRAEHAGVRREILFEMIRALPPQLLQQTYDVWFSEGVDPILRNAAERNSMYRPGIRLVEFRDLATLPPSLLIAARPDDDLLVEVESDSDLLIPADATNSSSDDVLLSDSGDGLLRNTDDDNLLRMQVDTADPLATPAHSTPNTDQRFDPNKMLPAGGWYRDDRRMSIAYRGTGHSDPVLRSAVELLSQLPPSDPVRKRLLSTRAIAACVSCHPAATNETGAWKSSPLIGRRDNFTKFAHGPHLHIAQLADCSACHQVGQSRESTTAEVTLTSGSSSSPMSDEFKLLELQTCASCHTAKAAGDNCTKCHRYHIDF